MDLVVVGVASGFGFDWVFVSIHTSDGSFVDFVILRVVSGFGFHWMLVFVHTSLVDLVVVRVASGFGIDWMLAGHLFLRGLQDGVIFMNTACGQTGGILIGQSGEISGQFGPSKMAIFFHKKKTSQRTPNQISWH